MRMAFAIMRCKKIKTAGGVASALQHCYRERQTLNADSEKLADNVHMTEADNVDTAMGLLRERLPEKRRKDAVLMVEYMMTASPEWWQTADKTEQDEFFKNSLDWLKEKYGEENVIVATIHNDEKTPHLSAFVTPITQDGRLSAKEFIGNKKKMSDDQTSYAKKVENLRLKRGVKGSKAKHQTIQKYYEILNKSMSFTALQPDDLTARKKGIFSSESKTEIANRLNKSIQNLAVKASNFDLEKRKGVERMEYIEKLEKELKTANSRLFAKTLKNDRDESNEKKIFEGLTEDQKLKLIMKSIDFKRENEQKNPKKTFKNKGLKI